MTLASLGWDDAWDAAWRAMTPAVPGGTVARVAVAHRGAVEVIDAHGQYWAEPTGKMFHQADDARGLPIVALTAAVMVLLDRLYGLDKVLVGPQG